MTSRLRRDAAKFTAPTLFHVQWDDELFPREGQLALFDLLGSRDKQLIAYTGSHGETRTTAIAVWRDFISWHLRPSAQASIAKPCFWNSGRPPTPRHP